MKHNQMRQVVFPILAAFIWGTAFVAQDMCADAIGAFAFNASRYSIAVLAGRGGWKGPPTAAERGSIWN